jgi:hypothetical protein
MKPQHSFLTGMMTALNSTALIIASIPRKKVSQELASENKTRQESTK